MTYAPLASDAFQVTFAEQLQRIAKDTEKVMGDNLASLVLGGGLGRGEGGITRVSGQEQAYNDVDLFLFVHRDPTDLSPLRDIESHYTKELGAHLEYSRPIPIESLKMVRPALMWFDLIHGNAVISGETDFIKRFAPEVSRGIPTYEGPRLWLNRGAGLIWAIRVQLGFDPAPDPDFIRRNVWKARLALAEGALIAFGKYVPRANDKRVAYSDWAKEARPRAVLLAANTVMDAFTFKQDPDRFPDVPDAVATAREWVPAFLELESLRYGRAFADGEAYRQFGAVREPADGLTSVARNIVRSLRAAKLDYRHPREALYRDLPSLLAKPEKTAEWRQASGQFLAGWRRHV